MCLFFFVSWNRLYYTKLKEKWNNKKSHAVITKDCPSWLTVAKIISLIILCYSTHFYLNGLNTWEMLRWVMQWKLWPLLHLNQKLKNANFSGQQTPYANFSMEWVLIKLLYSYNINYKYININIFMHVCFKILYIV